MQIQIRPTAFLVSAMTGTESAGFRVDSAATSLLATRIQIPIDQFTSVALLKPYLKVAVTSEVETLMVSIRFQCRKDGEVLYSTVMAKRLLQELTFEPEEVADIRTYRVRNRALGRWRMSAQVSIFPFKIINQVYPDKYDAFLSALRYQDLTGWDFEILGNAPEVGLLLTGRRIEPREEDGTTVTIDDL